MAQLTDSQRDLLIRFKDDLRKGKLNKLAKTLSSEYRYDRGPIIAYMIEKGVPILEAMSFIPYVGITDCNMPVLSIPGNIQYISTGGIGRNNCREIILEEGIERLESRAIIENNNLEKIILPNSLASLGQECFADNKNLKEVFIPDSITVLPKGVFDGCDNVTVLANYRADKKDRLKCVESEIEFYKNHLKWIRGE